MRSLDYAGIIVCSNAAVKEVLGSIHDREHSVLELSYSGYLEARGMKIGVGGVIP
jgi:hypothetical protein